MKTLFLGSYGFGNLGDELCLIEAMRQFPSTEVIAFSVDPEYTARCTGVTQFIKERSQIKEIKPQRVVLGGGGVGFWPSIRDSLHWMRDGWMLGAECHIHNIGLGTLPGLGWLTEDEMVVNMLRDLRSCSVRDHISWYLMKEWPINLKPQITYYPERFIEPDRSLSSIIKKDKPVLGVSIIPTALMKSAVEKNETKIRAFLEPYRDWHIAPIVSTVHGSEQEEDDIVGFKYFREKFLTDFSITGTEMLDRNWLREQLTPKALKGIIGSVDHLLSQRKHNCIHAIGMGVPFTGIFPGIDDSILRILFSVRDAIPIRSGVLSLPV